jgi:hypothetical protein
VNVDKILELLQLKKIEQSWILHYHQYVHLFTYHELTRLNEMSFINFNHGSEIRAPTISSTKIDFCLLVGILLIKCNKSKHFFLFYRHSIQTITDLFPLEILKIFRRQDTDMYRVVCAVNESLYYQMLCKGLLQSLLKHRSVPHKITVLLDGESSQPFDELRDQIEIVSVKPLDIICGCVSSRTTFARLEIPYIFPEEKRILYLDVDMYIMKDIRELFVIPFQTIGAVVPGNELMIKELIQREFQTKLNQMDYKLDGINYSVGREDHKYFNAGKQPSFTNLM